MNLRRLIAQLLLNFLSQSSLYRFGIMFLRCNIQFPTFSVNIFCSPLLCPGLTIGLKFSTIKKVGFLINFRNFVKFTKTVKYQL